VFRNRLFVSVLLIALALALPARAGLKAYVSAPDPLYGYSVVGTESTATADIHTIKLHSQTWRGIPWWHWLTVIVPKDLKHPGTALLLVDGGNTDNPDTPPGGGGEIQVLSQVALATGTITARVSQVPNQPLFDGKNEDAIIAYTYDQFLKSGEEDWPLLFPMVKSATAAMTAVQDVAKTRHEVSIEGFMLTGGSKRGWTSWLAAAADPRVKAIAPFVIDTLNMAAQSPQQMKTYGGYSVEVADYTQYDLQARMATPEGQKLLGMVDPYAYREELTLPKMIVLGTNDPYWTVDAANYYFDDLQGEKHLYYQANTAHDTSLQGIGTLTEFYRRLAEGKPYPEVSWQHDTPNSLKVRWDQPGAEALLWTAHSPNRDFRPSKFESVPLSGAGETVATVPTPETGWTAYYVEVRYPGAMGMTYGATTKMTVLPDTYPTSGRAYDTPQAASESEE
jgi:PhoPQ-activated pathogenicity-related protein